MARDRKKSKSYDVSAELERVPTRSLFRYMFFLPELFSRLNRYSNTIRGHRLICFLVGLSTFFLGLWVFDPKFGCRSRVTVCKFTRANSCYKVPIWVSYFTLAHGVVIPR